MTKKKGTINDLQNTTQKTKYLATRTPLKFRDELWCSRRLVRSWSTSGTHRVTLMLQIKPSDKS